MINQEKAKREGMEERKRERVGERMLGRLHCSNEFEVHSHYIGAGIKAKSGEVKEGTE